MSDLIYRPSPELFHAQQIEIILRGVSAGMEYLSKVPQHFRLRKWPNHLAAIDFSIAALCFYRWGQVADGRAFDTRFRMPPGLRFDADWRRLANIPRPRSRDVVKILRLEELSPFGPGCRFSPRDEEGDEVEPGLIVLPGGRSEE